MFEVKIKKFTETAGKFKSIIFFTAYVYIYNVCTNINIICNLRVQVLLNIYICTSTYNLACNAYIDQDHKLNNANHAWKCKCGGNKLSLYT